MRGWRRMWAWGGLIPPLPFLWFVVGLGLGGKGGVEAGVRRGEARRGEARGGGEGD
jgi:hypothetical protein